MACKSAQSRPESTGIPREPKKTRLPAEAGQFEHAEAVPGACFTSRAIRRRSAGTGCCELSRTSARKEQTCLTFCVLVCLTLAFSLFRNRAGFWVVLRRLPPIFKHARHFWARPRQFGPATTIQHTISSGLSPIFLLSRAILIFCTAVQHGFVQPSTNSNPKYGVCIKSISQTVIAHLHLLHAQCLSFSKCKPN